MKKANEIANELLDKWDSGYNEKTNLKDLIKFTLNSYAREVLENVLKKSEDKCTHTWDACYCLNEAIQQQIEELK